jgi:hypothetical protein
VLGFVLSFAGATERFLAGSWDDAIAELEAAMDLAAETGERYSLALGHSVTSLIALHRGDLRRAEEAAARAAGELADTGARYRAHWAHWAGALLLEANGATAEATATLGDVWDQCARSGLAIEYPALGPDLVRLALTVGDQARARQVATAVADLAASNEVPWLTGTALRCQGLLESDPEILLAAVEAIAQGSRPLELGLACEDAGAALAGTGRVDAGLPLLERALGSTSGWRPPVTWTGPRQGCQGWASAPAAGEDEAAHSSAGKASPPPRSGSWTWSSKASPTPRSASGCTCRRARCRPTSPTSSPSWASPPAPSSPPKQPTSRPGDR